MEMKVLYLHMHVCIIIIKHNYNYNIVQTIKALTNELAALFKT